MPRTVSVAVSTAVALPVTSPAYLVEIGFATTLRYATHRSVTWGGVAWAAAGIVVETVSAQEARLALANPDNAVSALVLGHSLADVPVQIYAYYGDDAELVFSGTLDEAPDIGPRVVLTARGFSGASSYPNLRIAAPQFNHITPAGTEIRWGNDVLILELQS